jgi:hypothetical protein
MERLLDESFFRMIYLESSEAKDAVDDGSNPFQYRLAVPLSILQIHSPALSKIASETPVHADCVIPLPVVPYVRVPNSRLFLFVLNPKARSPCALSACARPPSFDLI